MTSSAAHTAVKVYESPNLTHWHFSKYRVTTYPNSDRIFIQLWDKTSKTVRGRNIEAAARAAIAKSASGGA